MTETGSASGSGVARALNELTDETTGLVRRELDAARIELLSKASANAPGVALLASAGLLSVLSVASTHRWVLRVLEKRLPPATAALVAALAFGSGAGVAAVVGVEWLREAPTPLPTETARDVGQTASDVAAEVRDGTDVP